MRVLFLSQVLPYPLDAGPKVRSYFVLRHLARLHQVTLLTFVRDTDRSQDIAHLAEFCHAVHCVPMQRSRLRDLRFMAQGLLTQQPFLIVRDQCREMMEEMQRLVASEPVDVIHADQLWMAQYALAAKPPASRIPLILDQHNAVHLIPRRMADSTANPLKKALLSHEARALAGYETEACQGFDHVVWVSTEDRQAVNALSEAATRAQRASTVIPICTDTSLLEPVMPAANRTRITFLGGLHWPPNAEGVVWFAEQVLPQVRLQVPEAVFTVIGKNPPDGLEAAGVEITGYVTDPRPYLAETAVFIVPLHAGGGMRVKILDAWCWGLPIVSTTIGAEGIDTTPQQDILIADSPEAFASAVIDVIMDPGLAERLRQYGRRTVSEQYDWRTAYSIWDEVYRSLDGQALPTDAASDARRSS